MRNLEQELKLSLSEREYNILSALTRNQPQLQVNHYFISTHLGDAMVRLREKGGQYLLCYKKRLKQDDGVVVCEEAECEVSAQFAKHMLVRGISPEEIQQMLHVNLPERVTYVGDLSTYRTAFDWQEWHLELDKNEYCGKVDYELECECGYIQQLYKLKNYLSFNYGIEIVYSTPKSQRFFEAFYGKV